MGILLDKEDRFNVGMSVTKGGGDYADIDEVIDASAKAQLKKVAKKLDVHLCGCSEDEDEVTYRIPFKKWQALLKEAE